MAGAGKAETAHSSVHDSFSLVTMLSESCGVLLKSNQFAQNVARAAKKKKKKGEIEQRTCLRQAEVTWSGAALF